MAKDTIFKKLREEAKGRELSIQWYRNRIRALAPTDILRPDELIARGKVTATPNFGINQKAHLN